MYFEDFKTNLISTLYFISNDDHLHISQKKMTKLLKFISFGLQGIHVSVNEKYMYDDDDVLFSYTLLQFHFQYHFIQQLYLIIIIYVYNNK